MKQNNISTKLNKLLDLMQHTKKDQASSNELTIKMENYKLVKHFTNKYQNNRRLTRGDMITCNEIWKKYNNPNVDLKDDIWKDIDEFLKNGVKISAIKLYRNKSNCILKAAKNAIDKRYITLKENV